MPAFAAEYHVSVDGDDANSGTRVTGNLLHDNTNASKHNQDLFVEVNHGPFLIDNIISGLPFKAPDGSDFKIDRDYFDKVRKQENPSAGPFTPPEDSTAYIKVWPR